MQSALEPRPNIHKPTFKTARLLKYPAACTSWSRNFRARNFEFHVRGWVPAFLVISGTVHRQRCERRRSLSTVRHKQLSRQAQVNAVSVAPPKPKFSILPGEESDKTPGARLLSTEQSEMAMLKFQDTLYQRYQRRYIPLPLCPSASYQYKLLEALRHGNIAWLKEEIASREEGTWDFVFPPVPKGEDLETHEGWCRSPLSLMVRPREGYFRSEFLPGIARDIRVQLVRSALESRICSPHFEGNYWSCAPIHAALSGDVEMLDLLHQAGMDYSTLGVEWAVYNVPNFTVVHAAAMNGHFEALQWLANTYESPEWLDQEDASNCTALYYSVQTARSKKAARFLVQNGCDPFRFDPTKERSPFSVAVELMPEVAEEFLVSKSKPVFAWWGNPVIDYDFTGIAYRKGEPGQLLFNSLDGEYCSVEGLISRSNQPELASTPIVTRLADKKWEAWGRSRYFNVLTIFLSLMSAYVLEALSFDLSSAFQSLLLLSAGLSSVAYARIKVLELLSRGVEEYLNRPWNLVDTAIIALSPLGIALDVATLTGFGSKIVVLGLDAAGMKAIIDAFFCTLLFLRLLRYVAVVTESSFGTYVNNIVEALTTGVQPLLFLTYVITSFSIGFWVLFHYGARGEMEAPGLIDMPLLLLRWLFEPADALKSFENLRLETPGLILFLFYYTAAVIGTLQFTQGPTTEKDDKDHSQNRDVQWNALRVDIIDELEQQLRSTYDTNDSDRDSFYQGLSNSSETMQLETRTELWPTKRGKSTAKK